MFFTSTFSLYDVPSPEARWDSKGARPLAGPRTESWFPLKSDRREAAGGIPQSLLIAWLHHLFWHHELVEIFFAHQSKLHG